MKKICAFFIFLTLFFNYSATLISEEMPPSSHEVIPHATTPSPFPFEDIKQEQLQSSDDHFISDFMNMLASLGLIIAFIFIVSWFLKKFLNTRLQQMNNTSAIKIIEKRSLTPKSAVYLLEINDKSLIIAESANGVTLLSSSHLRNEQTFDQILDEKQNQENRPSS